MFCKYCGTRAGATGFCTSCGQPLPVPQTPSTPTRAAPAPAPTPAPAPSPATPAPQPSPAANPIATPHPATAATAATVQSASSPQQGAARVPQRDPRKRSSGLAVLGVVGASVLVLAGAGAAVWWLVGGDTEGGSVETADTAYGSNSEWDALWDSCEAGALSACDELYRVSPVGSDYESFGGSCGNRDGSPGFCAPEASNEGQQEGGFGTDPQLDLLWVECEEGNMFACDDLFFESAPGTLYEDYGATCGGRGTGDGDCVSQFP